MYQMLTGVLPYATPRPRDLDKLMTGELLTPPRLRNKSIPRSINDIVLKALSPDLTVRYARASELLEDVLATRDEVAAPKARGQRSGARHLGPDGGGVEDIQTRVKARAAPPAKFCWHCSKPLQARSAQCPFCGETQ
jgi:hypothetical protein